MRESRSRCARLEEIINKHKTLNRRVSIRLESAVTENEYLKQDSAAQEKDMLYKSNELVHF
jgi:hypothetical protein